MTTRTCERCGKPLDGQRADARFCGKDCRLALFNEKRKAARRAAGASPRNQRHARTPAEMTAFNRAIWDICEANHPLSARQCYYRAVVARLIEKDYAGTRANERMIGNALDTMRERGIEHGIYSQWSAGFKDEVLRMAAMAATGNEGTAVPDTYRKLGILPFGWLTDNTRSRYQAELYGSKEDALRDMADYYRRDLWRSQDHHVEVWCESDSIGGVLMDVTNEYGVALLPCRGQSSKRFIWDSARSYQELDKPVVCLYVGDFDPAGLDIGRSVQERLARYGADNVTFIRIAITPEQVQAMGLPGHGLNPNIAASVRERFTSVCDTYGIPHEAVEAEAMPPGDLRDLVTDHISRYIDQRQWALEQAVEEEERRGLLALVGDEDEE